MIIAADTNVLVRQVTHDDPAQAQAADRIIEQSSQVAISLTSLSELVWVLRGVYRFSQEDVLLALQTLLNIRKVLVNRPAAEAGLAALRAGGDFADGVIAYEGRWLGGETFVSFDRNAVALLTEQGFLCRLLR